MAITINWGTKVINIPRADMLLIQSVPTEIRQLNLNTFRQTLNDLQDDPEGISFPTTHRHVQPISVGGVTLERVVEIINGYTVTFEDGQYAVNLVGANSNVADVTNVNQVSVRSANSAGLVNLDTLLAASYLGRVHVDVLNGQAGTQVPLGTASTPVNNFADAKVIADNFGLEIIEIVGSATIPAGIDFSTGYTFRSQRPISSIVTVEDYAEVGNCQFENVSLTGIIDQNVYIRDALLIDLFFATGLLRDCLIERNLTLTPASPTLFGNPQVNLIDCRSNIPGGGVGQFAGLDFNGTDTEVLIRGYEGGLQISNYIGAAPVSIDMNSGRVNFDYSCDAGTITVRGVAQIEDESSGTFVVNDQTVRGNNQTDMALVERRIIEAQN